MRTRVSLIGILCLCVASCAELRFQTVSKPVWLSKAGDPASLATLARLYQGKTLTGNDPQFVRIDRGSQVYVTDFSTERCKGGKVFEKVQVKTGSQQNAEGWICGAFTTHHKAGAL